MDLNNLNGCIESDFELAEEAPTLGRHVSYPRDRSTIAQSVAGQASFRAELARVQYGTFKGQRACLLTFTFQFFCKDRGRLRFDSAEITIHFRRERKAGPQGRPPPSLNDDDDDYEDDSDVHILQLAPHRLHGAVKTVTETTTKKFEVPVGFQHPVGGFQASFVPGFEKTTSAERGFKLSVQGGLRSTAGMGRDDMAFWIVNENAVQRDGILEELQTAVVLRWPSGEGPVLANVRVTPTFSFSILHALQLMRQRRDDPIAFDGKTNKGELVDVGTDFADKAFSWSKVLQNHTESIDSILLV